MDKTITVVDLPMKVAGAMERSGSSSSSSQEDLNMVGLAVVLIKIHTVNSNDHSSNSSSNTHLKWGDKLMVPLLIIIHNNIQEEDLWYKIQTKMSQVNMRL